MTCRMSRFRVLRYRKPNLIARSPIGGSEGWRIATRIGFDATGNEGKRLRRKSRSSVQHKSFEVTTTPCKNAPGTPAK
ncbi:hypothetical protein BT69DRAFT_1284768 [Atractiella rhizophila]|nr:hypothetical protein BT69DRAFT_1284768 [Atractiella rhizophila]